MVNNFNATLILDLTGYQLQLLGAGDLAVKYITYSTYLENGKEVTIPGLPAMKILTYADILEQDLDSIDTDG